MMKENDLKDMTQSELIQLIMKLNKKQNPKYNLEHLFDDDSFSDNEIEPFDNKMREIY